MQTTRTLKIGAAALLVILILFLAYAWLAPRSNVPMPATADTLAAKDAVAITDLQARHINVVPASTHGFDTQLDATGYVDFNQNRLTQVFSPYQGRVLQVQAEAGDDVRKGQTLFTVESPDLVQAESNLISTAGLLALSNKTLERARKMLEVQANAQKDIEQAVSDQQTAEGNYQAARNAVRIFGKSDAAMDRIVVNRKVDDALAIVSPFAGQVTARSIAPGTLVQPGSATAPITVADLSSVWVVANVAEDAISSLRIGQPVTVTITALPNRTLQGKISYIGSAVDPNTHRIIVHAQIDNAQHQLHPQMLATFTVQTGAPMPSIAVPVNAVVREGDGTMTVFTTQDGRRFMRREVKLGLQQDGLDQVLNGLTANERVAGDGALFLSNALALQSQ